MRQIGIYRAGVDGFRRRSLRLLVSSMGSRIQSRPVERQRKQGTWFRASQRIFCRRHHRHALKKRTGMFSARKTISEPLSLMATLQSVHDILTIQIKDIHKAQLTRETWVSDDAWHPSRVLLCIFPVSVDLRGKSKPVTWMIWLDSI